MSEPTPAPALPADTSDLLAVRQAKLAALRAAGQDPFARNWAQTHTSAEALALWREEFAAEDAVTPEVSVAGRLTVFRIMGKAAFVKIQDGEGVLQLYFKRDLVGAEAFDAFKHFDLGDFVGAAGRLMLTKTGEVTVRVERFALVAKALRPLPEKWHGLADPEQVFRQRYLDLIVNRDSRERFVKRSRVLRTIREVLHGQGYLEVETPVLQATAGGAAARPFVTHFNALGCDFYLRIALELYLKRLLVGGFDRVFEIGRNFRNEGLSRKHNPEFTMLEAYRAYSDYEGMMRLTRELIQRSAEAVNGRLTVVNHEGVELDLAGEWRRAPYRDLLRERTGDADWFARPKAEKVAAARKLGVHADEAWEDYEVTQEIYSKLIEPNLIQPTFVTHLPRELIPLAKFAPGDPSTVEVFELCINGQEIAPGYSEQNDPEAQRRQLLEQAGAETQKLDEDFLLALEHGMPPAGGMGMGLDRLAILLTGAASIRDVILFPALRPAAS